jgi:serine/threonine-protein kinase
MDTIHFGKYILYQSLGEGAFGEVFLAHRPNLDDVAIKILKPAVAEDLSFVARFKGEARLLRSVRHPNVVSVLDMDVLNGRYYIVMDYCLGGSLARWIAARKEKGDDLSLEETLRLTGEAAAGLAALHRKDIVHCDLKPHNLLFDDDGHLLVGDLGLAQSPGSASSRVRSLEEDRPSSGTPGYQSPEQKAGELHLTTASDVYVLGMILFELLTLRQYSSRLRWPRLSELRPDAPAWLEPLLADMLATDPSARPVDAGEVLRRLEGRLEDGHKAKEEALRVAEVARLAGLAESERLKKQRVERAARQKAQGELKAVAARQAANQPPPPSGTTAFVNTQVPAALEPEKVPPLSVWDRTPGEIREPGLRHVVVVILLIVLGVLTSAAVILSMPLQY